MSVAPARAQLTAYLKYFRTPKKLKPLVYRPKNASELISRDLWDKEAKGKIVPLPSVTVPSSSQLTQVIDGINSDEEWKTVATEMKDLAYKKIRYTRPQHLSQFLEKSAELRRLSPALKIIYSTANFKPILNSEVLNSILLFHYINPNKGFLNSLEKTKVALKEIHDRTPVTNLLRLAIHLKFEPDASVHGLVKKIRNDKPLDIPHIDTSKGPGASIHSLNKNRALYLTLKPIEETLNKTFSTEAGQSAVARVKEVENAQKAIQFVQQYEEVERKLELENAFTQLKAKSLFGTAPEETVEEETASEEEQK